jgi:hypothetical protein
MSWSHDLNALSIIHSYEMPQNLYIYPYITYTWQYPSIYLIVHELVVRAQQLASVAQFIRALQQNHRYFWIVNSSGVRDSKV